MRKERNMNKFEDICPICGQEIAKEAVERGDAVICPDCGTSYHKACWEKAGGCVTFACPSKPKVQTQTQQPYQQQEQQQQEEKKMKYCSHCGKEILDEAVICPHCGCMVGNPQYTYNQTPEADIPSTGLNVLSLFFPLVGLILYIVYADKAPKKAKAIGKFALIGVAIEVVGGILWGCAAAMMTSLYLF